ncbi:MAG: glycosyltransferase family 9 protein [Bacteroidales bacterium]|jgi:heptosyltransferase-2|nr:glycosyltransferase family 9 protein [Bacteroidales bacterium]
MNKTCIYDVLNNAVINTKIVTLHFKLKNMNSVQLNTILVIQTASIGDVVLATSILETLHREYPLSNIDILVKKGNETLFDGHLFVNNVLIWNKNNNKYRNLLKLIREIRTKKYDLVINLQRFLSSGLMTCFSKSKQTRGFKKNPLSLFFTKRFVHHINIKQFTHEIDRNALLIADLCTSNKVEKPKLYPKVNLLFSFQNNVYYTISPSSLWKTKQMPIDKWVELVRLISKKGDVCLLGSKNDRELCEQIIEMSGFKDCINLCGKLSFLQSCNIMYGAKMNFTNDSAPLHFCSAVNAPVTAVFCSTVPEFGFTPLSENNYIIQTQLKLKCRPCGLHGHKECPQKHFACGNTIEISEFLSRF